MDMGHDEEAAAAVDRDDDGDTIMYVFIGDWDTILADTGPVWRDLNEWVFLKNIFFSTRESLYTGSCIYREHNKIKINPSTFLVNMFNLED